jgi:hypothetical protein
MCVPALRVCDSQGHITARGLHRQLFPHCDCRYRTQKGTSNELPAPGWGCTFFGSWNNCLVNVIQTIEQCLQATTKWNRHFHPWYVADMTSASLSLHSWLLSHSVDAAAGRHPQCGHPTLPNSPEYLPSQKKKTFHHVMQPKNYPKHDYTKVGAQFAGMGRDHCCHCTLHTHNMCHTPLPSPPQANTRTYRPHGSMMRGFEQSAQPQAPASTVAQHAHAS